MENNYISPESNVSDENPLDFLKKVDRPWGVYLVSVSFFFFVLGYISTYMKVLGGQINNPEFARFSILFAMFVCISMIVGIIKLNKWLTYGAIALSVITVMLNLADIVMILVNNPENGAYVVFKSIYVVPPAIGIWYLSRSKHRELMPKFKAFKHHEAMQKQAFKKTRL